MSSKITKLSKLRKGQKCIIDSFTNDVMKLKLMEMGCLPGETITVDRFAPMGDPMAIRINDMVLSLRMDEAETILVRKI